MRRGSIRTGCRDERNCQSRLEKKLVVETRDQYSRRRPKACADAHSQRESEQPVPIQATACARWFRIELIDNPGAKQIRIFRSRQQPEMIVHVRIAHSSLTNASAESLIAGISDACPEQRVFELRNFRQLSEFGQ